MARHAKTAMSTKRSGRIRICLLLCLGISCIGMLHAQAVAQTPTSAGANDRPAAPSATASTTTQNNCIEPEPTFTGLEYNGPFKKTIVHITGKPEIKTVEHPHEGKGR